MRKSLFYVAAFLLTLFISCSETETTLNNELEQNDAKNLESSEKFKSEKPGYEKIISKTLVKGEDCDEYVSGIIEHRQNGELLATIDYGNGDCDGLATKITKGESHIFSLNEKENDIQMDKVITKALIKGDDCDEYVSGIVELKKGGVTYTTIDYGEGDCDGVAEKIIDGKTQTFSLNTKDSKLDYEKVIIKKLVKGDDCDEYVSGIIDYRQGGKTLARVDYGNGECDGVAAKMADGESHTFNLTKENK